MCSETPCFLSRSRTLRVAGVAEHAVELRREHHVAVLQRVEQPLALAAVL